MVSFSQICVCVGGGRLGQKQASWQACGSQKTTLCNQLPPSTFMCVAFNSSCQAFVPGFFLTGPPPYLLRLGLSLNLQLANSEKPSGRQDQESCLSLPPWHQDYWHMLPHLDFYTHARDPNTDLHACRVNTLSTELSSQTPFIYLCIYFGEGLATYPRMVSNSLYSPG